jgi:hypothetical protein
MSNWVDIEKRFREEIAELALRSANDIVKTNFLVNSEKKLNCLRLLYDNSKKAGCEYPFLVKAFSKITMKDIFKSEKAILPKLSKVRAKKKRKVYNKIKTEFSSKKKTNNYKPITAQIISTPMK